MKKIYMSLNIVCLLLMLLAAPALVKSQTAGTSKDKWYPLKVQSDNSNTINGVSFFKNSMTCDGKPIVIIKAVNSNNFPVRVFWQDKDKKSSFVIPASSDVTGTCDIAASKEANNQQKILAFAKPDNADEVEDIRLIISHIKVIEEK